jgi:hypothetical protein
MSARFGPMSFPGYTPGIGAESHDGCLIDSPEFCDNTGALLRFPPLHRQFSWSQAVWRYWQIASP